jgi:hypothetical protein
MMKCWELDLMRKFKADSRLCLLTNKLVSSAFKSIDETIYRRYCKEIQNPCLLHRNLNPQDMMQVYPLSTKLKKSQKEQKSYFKK